MTAGQYLPLFAVWLLGVISPGPDALLVSREVVRHGRAHGIEAALGIATGVGVWVVIASLAGAALTDGGGGAVTGLELVGGAYLVWLGLSSLRAPGAQHAVHEDESGEAVAARRLGGSFAVGLITNLLNPKALLFFAALFGALVPATATTRDRVLIGVVFVITEAAWFCSVAVMVGRATSGPGAAAWRRRLDLASGTLFLALGTVAVVRGLQGLG